MIEIPEKIEIFIEGTALRAKGPKGECSKNFKARGLRIERDGNRIIVESPDPSIGKTVETQIKNMIKGVSEGYSAKMKVLYSHFPISLEIRGKEILIKNFLGEKQPRISRIVGNTKVEVKGREISISGTDKNDVGQTIANIKAATKISRMDPRVFQDGIYLVE